MELLGYLVRLQYSLLPSIWFIHSLIRKGLRLLSLGLKKEILWQLESGYLEGANRGLTPPSINCDVR